MSLRCARIGWIMSLLLALTLAGSAHAAGPGSGSGLADDPCLKETECREHYQRAIGLYESGRYEAALPEFQAAYQSRPQPWLLINIGRTLHRLGRLDEAITFYNRYEQAAPNDDPETTKKVREYKAQAEVLLSAKGASGTNGATPSATPGSATDQPVAAVSGAGDKPRAKDPQPVYKKWWFWTAIGGGAAVILITGIAVGVSANGRAPIPGDAVVYMPTF